MRVLKFIKVLFLGWPDQNDLKNRVMSYEHPSLIKRLMKKLDLTKEQAEEAFLGMKQFLFLCGTKDGEEGLAPQSVMVDEAWHHFMLFSRDYHRFCFGFFGRLIHHQPTEEGDGDGGHSLSLTKKGLLREFNLPLNPALASNTLSCINVPEGDCSGSTNCQDSCKSE